MTAAAAQGSAVLRWQDIPVFIVNRNRHAALRTLVEWLKDCGTAQVFILDNQSTYAPLLAWYESLPAGVRVQRFGQNHGPYVFWKHGVHKTLATPYVFTDSDLVPASFCPGDLIGKLHETLCAYPDAEKVGPSLRIDNLSTAYGQAGTVFQWESQFWERPLAPGLFSAPVDTTFGLYKARGEFTRDNRNIRLGHPYTMEHTPWYVDEAAMTEEERFYRANTSREFSHWSGADTSFKLTQTERIQAFDARPRVLHLGGGDEYIPGWINADSSGRQLDVSFTFERCGSERLPLDDSSIDGIYMPHSLQRVHDVPALMGELRRVARPGARLHLRVPHGASNASFADPRAVRPWFEDSFAGLAPCPGGWQVEERTLVVDAELLAEGADAVARAVRRDRNVVRDMCITLRAVAPGQPVPPAAPVRHVADPRIAPRFERA